MRATWVLLALALVCTQRVAADDDRQAVTGAIDLSYVHVSSPFDTWLDEGEGKLRYDEDHDGLHETRMFLDYRGRITPTLVAHGTLNVTDDKDRLIDFTEGFLEWRPVPTTPWRVRSRFGAFYPRLSLENVDAGWSSPYALSSSAINTWIGEELRTIGAEARLSRTVSLGSFEPELSVEGAMFYGNDPAGAMLNYRGWAIHDRQTGLLSSLPLPEVPAIEPWAPVPYLEKLDPFKEIDHQPGFYAGAEWRGGEGFRLKVFHYDNHGDPEAHQGADYAWQTRFNHVGVQFTLPGDVGVIGQYIDGVTRMGRDLGPWRVWDSLFDSRFVLVTRAFGRHRLTARFDAFEVQPYNDPGGYTNQDVGQGWMAGYIFEYSKYVRLGAEYLSIATDHCKNDGCEWVEDNGLPRTSRSEMLQLSLRLRFAGTR